MGGHSFMMKLVAAAALVPKRKASLFRYFYEYYNHHNFGRLRVVACMREPCMGQYVSFSCCFRTSNHGVVGLRRSPGSKQRSRPRWTKEKRLLLPHFGERTKDRAEGDERPLHKTTCSMLALVNFQYWHKLPARAFDNSIARLPTSEVVSDQTCIAA